MRVNTVDRKMKLYFKRVKKESQLKAPVKAFMKTDVKTIAPGKSATEAARLMVKYDIGHELKSDIANQMLPF